MSPEELEEFNNKTKAITDKQFEEFTDDFSKGVCNMCGNRLTAFAETEPCLHWLLNPPGIKKKHLRKFMYNIPFGRVQSYIRWVANQESRFKNINDLKNDSKKLIEETAKYKNIEWSLSCGKNDFEGHDRKSFHSSRPHYHFQMKIDGNIFVKFNEWHLPFSKEDIFFIMAQNEMVPEVMFRPGPGSGINEIFNVYEPEELLDNMLPTDDIEDAPLRTQTLITAEEGKTINMSELLDIINKGKDEGKTIAQSIKQTGKFNATSYISEGPGVIELSQRNPTRQRKKPSNSEDD